MRIRKKKNTDFPGTAIVRRIMNKEPFLYSCAIILLLSCGKKEEHSFQLPENAEFLLASDSAKTWKLAGRFNNKTRMNMGDCFLSYRSTYRRDMRMQDNSGDERDCGQSLKAAWKFAKDLKGNYYIKLSSQQLRELMNSKNDFKLFKVLRLSQEQMTLQYRHQQFSNKFTTITDIYVPEGDRVEGRIFHW